MRGVGEWAGRLGRRVRYLSGPARRRVNKTTAVVTAVVTLAASGVAVGVAVTSPSRPGPPAQQTGTAAGLPHRMPASSTIATTVPGGKVEAEHLPRGATARAARAATALRMVRPPKGAVPAASKPPKPKRTAAKPRDRVRVLSAPTAPAVKGFKARSSKVVAGQTSPDRVVYQNADGTRTAQFFDTPVNYRLPDGSWARVNTSLVPVGTGAATPSPPASRHSPPPLLPAAQASPSLTPAAQASPSASPSPPPASAAQAPGGWREEAAAAPETFAPYADGSPLLTEPLGGGTSVGLSVAGAAHVAGSAAGNVVTYAAARPDAGLRVVAGAGVADLRVMLDSASAPRIWVFPLRLAGLRAREGHGGSIEFISAAGQVAAVMPHGLMADSKINSRSGSGAESAGVRYALVIAGGRPAIKMTLDKAWLDSSARVFPVTVDPDVSSYNSGGTTYVESPSNADFSGGPEIKAGTYDGGGNIARAFMAFGNVKSSLANDTVLGARLGLFNTWSYSCSPRPVNVYPVNSSWSVTGSKAYPGPSIGPVIGSKSFATGWVPLGSTVSPCPASWEGIDLNQAGTNLVNGWTHGTIPDDGLALAASPGDSYGWKKFASGNVANGDPFLSVTYTPYGAKYALASSQPVTQVSPTQNGKIAIRVTNTGSATWTSSTGYELSYDVYNARGKLVASHPVFTPLPATVAPGASAVVDATVDQLPVGDYAIDFDMYAHVNTSSPVSFLSQGIAPFAIGLHVPQPPPVVTAVYPPTGYISPTIAPELSTTAFSTTNTAITYRFTLTCQPLPGSVCPAATIVSPSLTVPYWTPPTAMTWNEPYTWTVTATTNGTSATIGPMTITPQVPQPAITSGLGSGSGGRVFDPQSGNFTTSATDAAEAVPGPPLQIDRTYNSLDPRISRAFGAGWASVLDAGVAQDSDGSGNVAVVLPDGEQMRFGYNAGTNTYAPPMGSPDVLARDSDGTWTLMGSTGQRYQFGSDGTLQKITNPEGLAQTFTSNAAGEVTAIADAASGRALQLTWSIPADASYPHVKTVTTDSPASGQPGLTWDYSYTGDDLARVCGPAGGCTSYSYGSGSDYRSAVLDAGPQEYWQFGEASGTAAGDEVDANLGTTGGTYTNVTLGATGPAAGSAETAASFNGTSSYVSLPANLVADQSYVSVGLWFKAASSTASGVLFSYSADAITNSNGNSAPHVPALYVGGNGRLYGELWNGSADPMSSPAGVDDGNWHYAVLTGSATSQSLYLDGTEVGTMSGQISPGGLTNDTVGAGFWGSWPADYVIQGPAVLNAPVGYFDGSIGQVAVYPHPLGGPAIAGQYAVAKDASPELTQVTLPSGRVHDQVTYDAAQDRVATYTDPNGGQWQISQPLTTGYKASSDALGEATRAVTVSTPAGYQQVYGYDAVNGGRLVSFTPGNGDAPETFGYDAAGFLNQVQDSDGTLITMTNDIHGNVVSRTWFPIEPGSSAGNASTREGPQAPVTSSSSPCTATGAACTAYYTYYYNTSNPVDPRNNELTGAADARSASPADTTYLTKYAYNTAGELTSSTTPPTSDFPSGRTTSYAYSTSSTAASGGGTTPPGLLVSSTAPGGAVTSYSYYSGGDQAQVTQPTGAKTVYTYDGLGRALTATTSSDTYPGGLTTSYAWTPDNRPATVTHPGVTDNVTGVTHTPRDAYAYDADRDLTSLTQSDLTGGDPARVTSYTYDDHGEVASVTQPGGATSGGGTQSEGAASANPAGATTGYSYNDSGQIATMVDPDGNEYHYAYNEYGNLTQTTLTVNSASLSLPGGGSSLVLGSYAYDPAGLLAATTDAMGRTTSYQYNGDQELVSAQELSPPGPGRMTTDSYDPAGNLTRTDVSDDPVTTANQTITSYSYDAANRLDSTVTGAVPSGATASGYPDRTTSYIYNAGDLVTSKTTTGAGGPASTGYRYNTAGEMTSQSVVNGSASDTTSWTYDQLGQQVSMTSPDGNASGATPANFTTNYAYDQAGNLAAVTGPPVAASSYTAQAPATTRPVTSYGYDTFGDQTQTTDPDGNTTTTGYDGAGRVLSVTQPAYTPPGSPSAVTAVTKYGYDENGNLTSVTDPAGNTTSYTYDALGDMLSRADPQLPGQSAPGTWAYTYDSDGEQLSATSPTGAQTQATYDGFGDQASTTQAIRTPSGTQYNTTAYAYDYLGDPLTTTTPGSVVTTDGYDHLGELTTTTNAYGDTTSYAYNYAGQLGEVINPDGTSAGYGYDGNGNLTTVTRYGASAQQGELPPVLATQAYGYDPSGNQTSATNPDDVTTSYAYNPAGELTSQTQPVSTAAASTTSYGYDENGNQTSVTDARGNTTWTTYNSWNRPQSVIEPATAQAETAPDRTWTTAYSADGQPATVSQPGGVTQAYGYNQLGDLTAESGSGAQAATPAQSFGYDQDGRLTSATAPGGGTDTFAYNDAGQVTGTAGPSGTASFGYSPDGLMTSRTDKAGTTSYTYDKAGRLATVTDPLTHATLSYGYNADSLPTTIGYTENGTTGPAQSMSYDGLQRLTADALTSASGATIASAAYGYNADGDLTSQATTGYAGSGSTTYGYDKADELTSAATGGTTISYGYDADGNLTQAGGTSYTYNAQDQPVRSTTAAGATSYGYTLSGALASVTPPSGTVQNYTSNAYGQTVTAPGGISYGYDALGRLATRTTSTGTASFAYSGTSDTLASDGTTSYSYDPSGSLVAEQPSGGAAEAALTDLHSDVTGTFGPASSTSGLAASAAYSPYGAVTASSGTMPAASYQGQYTDPSTGDTDMGARWYSPSTGAFTSNDTLAGSPMPATISPSPYGYVSGNPLTITDPTGHCWGCSFYRKWINYDRRYWQCVALWRCWSSAPSGREGYAGPAKQSYPGEDNPSGEGSLALGGSDGGNGCGFFCGVGIGIVAVCAYNEELCGCLLNLEVCAPVVPPPPPPPPPQDCYSASHPCAVPPAPKTLRNTPHKTENPGDTTNPNKISQHYYLFEKPPSEAQLLQELGDSTSGADPSAGENGGPASGQGSGTSPNPSDIGQPATPEPSAPESGNPNAGNPNTTPEPPKPPSPKKLNSLQRAGIGGGIGAVTNVAGDVTHGHTNPATVLLDATAGFVTGAIGGALGGLGNSGSILKSIGIGAGVGAGAGGANSLLTQLNQNHSVNFPQLGVEAALGGVTGGFGPLLGKASFIGGGEGARAELVNTIAIGLFGLGPAVCDPGNAFSDDKICPW